MRVGQTSWFEYHCWESPESSDAEAWYRSHQQVEVVNKLGADVVDEEEVGSMFLVRFADGHEHDVFEDELFDDPSQFERPDPPPRASLLG